jgi:hypothetical protein
LVPQKVLKIKLISLLVNNVEIKIEVIGDLDVSKLFDLWGFCSENGIKIKKGEPTGNKPPIGPVKRGDYYGQPTPFNPNGVTFDYSGQPCIWDSIDIPQGQVYGLSCPCPKCSVRC